MLRGPALLDMPTSLDLPDIADLSITDFGALGRQSSHSEDVSPQSASTRSLNADAAPLPKPKASIGATLGVAEEGVSDAGVDLAPIVANLETAAPARNENQDANATSKSFIDAAKNQASQNTNERTGTQGLETGSTSPRSSAEKAATMTTNSKVSKTSSSGLGGALLAAIRAPENRAKLRRADLSAASDDANRHRARDAKADANTLPQPQSQLTLAEEMRLNLARRQKVLSGKLDEEQQAADAARRASLQGSVLAVAAAGKFLRSVPEEDGGGGRGVASNLSPRARASRRRHLESARSPGVQGLALSMDNMGSIDAFLDLKNQPGDELGASDADQSSASGWDTD
ncbi:Hypothetical Protein FCC1311_027452 [Hondaea fermentalgiana]|uniref:WH2 domain-containing protein n=1 Tax=Hondaea fermentalgiana TaxID=2315210 RepID=A0A2R5GFA6_9STRA|nr:Hypothetical Protein FCC1311_027452 [Hondaea fermentalgiana]|eukprot:GBG26524.1 Hypothetical Protein FCC1311_027452 [Hondaea fermentalgiana]